MKWLLALLPVVIAFQAGVPPALAWTWPADGPVLRAFAFGDDPYAGGHHRGIDVAGESGAPVRSPAAGVVSFAGTVPGGGRTVTVQTADGYSVTLVHLGTIAVAREAVLSEGVPVGTIGPTGDVEHADPYVHLGIRVTSEAHGYLDPLSFLPSRQPATPALPVPPADPVPAVPPGGAPAPPPAPEAPALAPEAPVLAPEAPVLAPEVPVLAPEAPASAPEAPVPKAPAPVAEAPSRDAVEPRASVPVPASSPNEAASTAVARHGLASAGGQRVTAPSRGAYAADGKVRRSLVGSFEAPAPPTAGPQFRAESGHSAARSQSGSLLSVAPIVAATATLLALIAALALRRRQLVHAVMAHALTPVLEHGAGRAAEHTDASRSGQEDRLILDRDLERVTLGEPEPFPNFDGDDDPAELVEMANDACRRLPATVALSRFHRVRPRPPSRCGRAETVSTR